MVSSGGGGSSGLSGGAIAGIVIGSVVGALLLVACVGAVLCLGVGRGDKTNTRPLHAGSSENSRVASTVDVELASQPRATTAASGTGLSRDL